VVVACAPKTPDAFVIEHADAGCWAPNARRLERISPCACDKAGFYSWDGLGSCIPLLHSAGIADGLRRPAATRSCRPLRGPSARPFAQNCLPMFPAERGPLHLDFATDGYVGLSRGIPDEDWRHPYSPSREKTRCRGSASHPRVAKAACVALIHKRPRNASPRGLRKCFRHGLQLPFCADGFDS